MAQQKINNVRVHVWTKSELNQTKKQLKDGGFRLESGVQFEGSFRAYDGDDLILSSGPGPGNMMYVRVDETYFDYDS